MVWKANNGEVPVCLCKKHRLLFVFVPSAGVGADAGGCGGVGALNAKC